MEKFFHKGIFRRSRGSNASDLLPNQNSNAIKWMHFLFQLLRSQSIKLISCLTSNGILHFPSNSVTERDSETSFFLWIARHPREYKDFPNLSVHDPCRKKPRFTFWNLYSSILSLERLQIGSFLKLDGLDPIVNDPRDILSLFETRNFVIQDGCHNDSSTSWILKHLCKIFLIYVKIISFKLYNMRSFICYAFHIPQHFRKLHSYHSLINVESVLSRTWIFLIICSDQRIICLV